MMKCQKCARPAMVHLTEILTHTDVSGETKRAVEIHLCLAHAVEAGLLAPGADPHSVTTGVASPSAPAKIKTKALASAPERVPPAEGPACPLCGTSWNQFKSGGVMGCTHDYELFKSKLLPLLKRAQEGATEHTGKVPARRHEAGEDRRRQIAALQRQLQAAVDAEQYETAVKVRDELRRLG